MTNIRKISNELAAIAQQECNEVPERVQSDIQTLKNWIHQTPYLKSRTDDQFLVSVCKYSGKV